MKIRVSEIVPSPYQPRLHFETEELEEDMAQNGMHQPIMVRTEPPKGKYELLDGDRRVHAARKLGWTEIEADVRRNVGDEEAMRIVYAVNTQRQDYTIEENARFFKRLHDEMKLNYAQIARDFTPKHAKKTPHTIREYIAILSLPESTQGHFWNGDLGLGHIHKTVSYFGTEILDNPKRLAELLQVAVDNKWGGFKYEEYLKQQKILERIEEARKKAQEEEAKRREEERRRKEAEKKALEEERKRLEAERAEQERLRREAEEARKREEAKARLLEIQRKKAEEEAKKREKEVEVYEKSPEPVKQAIVEGVIEPEEAEKIGKLKPEKQEKVLKTIRWNVDLQKKAKENIIEEAKEPEPPPMSEEEIEELKERLESFWKETQEILSKPETQRQGKLFRNWVKMTVAYRYAHGTFCPKCGSDWTHLRWTCCDIDLKEAQKLSARAASAKKRKGGDNRA